MNRYDIPMEHYSMRAAGAILLAISVLPNGGMSTAGDDSVYGISNNPYDSRRIPGMHFYFK